MIGEFFDPRKEFGKAVTEIARENPDVVVFSADSGKSSGFADFMKEFPDRYFECGIMEQGVVGIAAGMATTGKTPVFCAIAPFVTARPFEMVRNDLGYMNQNVKIVGRNCGITYSDLGATHQSLDDFAIMRMIPGMTVLAPQDPGEIRQAARAMLTHKGPAYMRIGNPKIPQLFEEKPFQIGKGEVLREGTDVTIFSTGSATLDALEAVDLLKDSGVSARLVGLPTVWPLDVDLVMQAAIETGKVVTAEEHYADGGLGTIITEALSEQPNVVVKRLGMPKAYAVTCGNYRELLRHYRLDAEGIADSVGKWLQQ